MFQPSGIFNTRYQQYMGITRTRVQLGLLIVFLILLFTVPLFANRHWLSFAIVVGVTIIAVHGLNIATGYCGLITVGHAAFVGVGAYATGILMVKLGFPFWVALPCAGLIAGLVGVVFGLPSLRVKGFYLALATLASQFILGYIFLHATGLTGGSLGMKVPSPQLGSIVFDSSRSYYYIVLVTAILMTFFAMNLARTGIGRAFIAIRDNDLAAEAIGVSLFRYKLICFFIACAFAGVAGGLWAGYIGTIEPESFTLLQSIWYMGMAIVGGLGSTLGVILGSVSIRLLEELLAIVTPMVIEAFPALGGQLTSAVALVFFGLVLILFLVFEPRGLAHRWQILKSYYRLWPFGY